ncbi:LAFA_0F21330g1_1 [Lachancea sp. 'fantastica']|nr:LAFA_0F21330g1_1 [Lachancea sp. 'fantastica']
MSSLDSFIEDNDKRALIDTSSKLKSDDVKVSAASKDSPRGQTITTPNSTKSMRVHPQISPASPSNQEHPLRDVSPRLAGKTKLPRSNTVKRLSLIQPVVSPLSTPQENRQTARLNTRRRSQSTISDHSRSSSGTSELHPQTEVGAVSVNSLLQLLASKELELLETKRKIEELRRGLGHEEAQLQLQAQQLQDLKNQVGRTVYAGVDDHKNMRNSRKAPNTSNPPQQASVHPSVAEDSSHSMANKESMWSKPLTFFNQFDQLIQHELEKKLHWDEVPSPTQTPVREAESGVKPSEDVLGNVSSSLWSFVSDVKTGLMGINEEPTSQDSQQRPGDASPLVFVEKETELEDLHDKKSE